MDEQHRTAKAALDFNLHERSRKKDAAQDGPVVGGMAPGCANSPGGERERNGIRAGLRSTGHRFRAHPLARLVSGRHGCLGVPSSRIAVFCGAWVCPLRSGKCVPIAHCRGATTARCCYAWVWASLLHGVLREGGVRCRSLSAVSPSVGHAETCPSSQSPVSRCALAPHYGRRFPPLVSRLIGVSGFYDSTLSARPEKLKLVQHSSTPTGRTTRIAAQHPRDMGW